MFCVFLHIHVKIESPMWWYSVCPYERKTFPLLISHRFMAFCCNSPNRPTHNLLGSATILFKVVYFKTTYSFLFFINITCLWQLDISISKFPTCRKFHSVFCTGNHNSISDMTEISAYTCKFARRHLYHTAILLFLWNKTNKNLKDQLLKIQDLVGTLIFFFF